MSRDNPRPDPDDAALANRARALYAAQAAALDAATTTALRARRHAALSAMREAPARRAWWWPAAGGLATAALALAVWLPRDPAPVTAPVAATPTAEDAAPAPPAARERLLDAAAEAEDAGVELDEDAGFYLWLAEAPVDDFPLDSATNREGWSL